MELNGPLPRPLDLDALAAQWWMAFAAADRAVAAAGRIARPEVLSECSDVLRRQNERVARSLHVLARDHNAGSPLVRWLGGPPITRRVLGLPDEVMACVFDLDGVLTTSQDVHVAAWADTLDRFLFDRAERSHELYVPFDRLSDYRLWVAGKPRLEGLRAFLRSRRITLPEGDPGDPPSAETVHGLARRKNDRLRRRLDREGVIAFAGSRSYLEATRVFGLHRAVVSASANTDAILARAGLTHLIDERIDGETIRTEHLRSKPQPDTLLAACTRLGATPGQSAAFESSRAGVMAAQSAGFAVVIGVNRHGQSSALGPDEADLVINDLGELLTRAERHARGAGGSRSSSRT